MKNKKRENISFKSFANIKNYDLKIYKCLKPIKKIDIDKLTYLNFRNEQKF